LFVVRGKVEEELPKLLTTWRVSRVFWESDTEAYARERDARVSSLLNSLGVAWDSVLGHTLYSPQLLVETVGGAEKVPRTYEGFLKLLGRLPPPPKPYPTPTALPPATLCGISPMEYGVPTLEECGFEPARVTTVFKGKGGEAASLAHLKTCMAKIPWVQSFEKPSTPPTALTPSTTALSPALKFGCLGVRTFYHALECVPGKKTSPPVSLTGQLLWREFYYLQSYATPNYDRMVGNPICRQIPWDYSPSLLKAWEDGETGFPWIDACQRQLVADGWLHHLGRHAVACFLTRGDLWQSWEHGAALFDKHLLDSDWALNNGNWQWLSCSAFFYQYFRVYSPVAFPKKTDPRGEYVRKWLPHLAKLPDAYIYEPWKAPPGVLKAAGVSLGVNYPLRIVDHEESSKKNMSRMAAAYEAHKVGEDAERAQANAAHPLAKGVGGSQSGSSAKSTEEWSVISSVPLGTLPPHTLGDADKSICGSSKSISQGDRPGKVVGRADGGNSERDVSKRSAIKDDDDTILVSPAKESVPKGKKSKLQGTVDAFLQKP